MTVVDDPLYPLGGHATGVRESASEWEIMRYDEGRSGAQVDSKGKPQKSTPFNLLTEEDFALLILPCLRRRFFDKVFLNKTVELQVSNHRNVQLFTVRQVQRLASLLGFADFCAIPDLLSKYILWGQ